MSFPELLEVSSDRSIRETESYEEAVGPDCLASLVGVDFLFDGIGNPELHFRRIPCSWRSTTRLYTDTSHYVRGTGNRCDFPVLLPPRALQKRWGLVQGDLHACKNFPHPCSPQRSSEFGFQKRPPALEHNRESCNRLWVSSSRFAELQAQKTTVILMP